MGKTIKRYCHCGRKASANSFLCKFHIANPDAVLETVPRLSLSMIENLASKRMGSSITSTTDSRSHQGKQKRNSGKVSGWNALIGSMTRVDKQGMHFVQGGRPESNRFDISL